MDKIITTNCSREKENATQRKTLKNACYKSKERGPGVHAWSQLQNQHKLTLILLNTT